MAYLKGYLYGFLPDYSVNNQLNYNQLGFLIPNRIHNEPQIIQLIDINRRREEDGDDGFLSETEELQDNSSIISDTTITIGVNLNNDADLRNEYKYHIHIHYDDDPYGISVAYGDVTICYSIDDNNQAYIQRVLVNDVINGPLHDTREGLFMIYPFEYLRILFRNVSIDFIESLRNERLDDE